MPDVDWNKEIGDTAFTVDDALSEFMAVKDDCEALVIVAAVKADAKKEAWRNCVIVRRSMPQSYIAIGLLRDALDSVLRRDVGSTDGSDD